MKTALPQASSFGCNRPGSRSRRNRFRAPRRIQPRLDLAEDRTLLSIFTVSNTANSGAGSLRQAIVNSNAATGQTNQIDFAIPGGQVQTIKLTSRLPSITSSVLIDGWSQPGFRGAPLIELNGRQAGGASGLSITGSNVTIRGLDIIDFSSGSGILISGASAIGNAIYGNFLGIDPTGREAAPNLYGIQIASGASSNLIGGATSTARNVISGNINDGVVIGAGTSGNVVAGNFIGTDAFGTAAYDNAGSPLGNGNAKGIDGAGVLIDYGASNNTVGGTTDGARNLISGNLSFGVWLYGSGTAGNVVEGNYIGTDATGAPATGSGSDSLSLGNGYDGIYINAGASDNTIGGPTAAARNLISGNINYGVAIFGVGTNDNVLEGNFIGTDGSGMTAYDSNGNALGNGYDDVRIFGGASANTVGGTVAGAGNIISGSATNGVEIDGTGTQRNVLQANFIGTNAYGTSVLDSKGKNLGNGENGNVTRNHGDGVAIHDGATENTIGGTTAGARNVISGNANNGVEVSGSGTSGNVVAGNYIGTSASGDTAFDTKGNSLGNGWYSYDGANDGVVIDSGATANTIGGATTGARNVISGNQGDGVEITDSGTSGNLVEGNFIGTSVTGDTALDDKGNSVGNYYGGVAIDSGASKNTIGGLSASGRNVISGNQNYGIEISDAGTIDNVIVGNYIGTDASGTKITDSNGKHLGNGYNGNSDATDGLEINLGASDNTVGGTAAGAGNVISGNAPGGVSLLNSGTVGNVVEGNKIGTDVNGSLALGNATYGVQVAGGASGNIIGGGSAEAGNLIADNGWPGVLVLDNNSIRNQITANQIFANAGPAIGLGGARVTQNAPAPRQGPNQLQNFPILLTAAGGQLEGVLQGSSPDTTFRIDVYASGSYGPGGAGEAEVYLGSMQVTTDSQGRVIFSIPFSPPPGLPIVTATATDPQGNTSEVSPERPGVFVVSKPTIRVFAGQTLVFSSAAGDGIALQDPDASPLDLTWSLSMSVTRGSLALSSTSGLTGSGNGTAALSYSGALSAIDAALENMTYTPEPGFNGEVVLSLSARSDGAALVQSQVDLTSDNNALVVTTTADSGPGSLRQAILDADSNPGLRTIDFAIPGPGVHTITPLTALSAITGTVLVDGWSQPGFSGTPLIEISGSLAGKVSGLVITGAGATVRGLDISDFTSGAGINITGAGAVGNQAYGNFLGTDPTGTRAMPNDFGIKIDGGASANIIGPSGNGLDSASGQNVVSGNSVAGVWIDGQGTDGNVVSGNLIGTSVTGDTALPDGTSYIYRYSYNNGNSYYDHLGGGVVISGRASGNWIGAGAESGAGEPNVISGNASFGVQLSEEGTSNNVVQGNMIGTDLTGATELGNLSGGIDVESGASDNTLGGTSAGAGNVIIHNGGPGILVTGNSSAGDQITANQIFANTGKAIDLSADRSSGASGPGPNDSQSYPLIFSTVAGQLVGWLGGSSPDTTFRVDIFASSSFGQEGAGEAEQFLGSLEVTTNNQGQAYFGVPFTPPAGMPVLTASATDPAGDTSEVSAGRTVTLNAPTQTVRLDPGQSNVFTTASSDGFAIKDPAGGTLNPAWEFTLSVTTGTLSLASTVGLAGAGNGTASLAYGGTLAAIDAALSAVRYAPPPGYQGNSIVTLTAESTGASALQAQFHIVVTNGIFTVTTTADSGPGSLRQAILDSNAAIGRQNTIDFAIPGTGLHTIHLGSPLPPVTNSVLIDGSSQPGYAGIPLIELNESNTGDLAGFTVIGCDITASGLRSQSNNFSFGTSSSPDVVTLPLVSLRPVWTGAFDTYRIATSMPGELLALLNSQGAPTRLTLLDAQGQMLDVSNGGSNFAADNEIEEQLPAGTYYLTVASTSGAGEYALTATLVPENASTAPIGTENSPYAIVAGDFNGDGKLDLAIANSGSNNVSVFIGNGNGTFQPAVEYAVGQKPEALAVGDFAGDGKLDLAVANAGSNNVSVLQGNGDGTFQPQAIYAVGTHPDSLVAGNFTASGKLDLAVANAGSNDVSVLLGNGDGTFQTQVTYAVGSYPMAIVAARLSGDGHTDLATANDVADTVSVLPGNGDGTFRRAATYVVGPGPVSIAAGDYSGDGYSDLATANWRGNDVSLLLGDGSGSISREVTYKAGSNPSFILAGDFAGDAKLALAVANAGSNSVSVLAGNGDGTFLPQVTYSVGSSPYGIAAGDFTGNGKVDLAVVNWGGNSVSVLLDNGDGTFRPLPAGTGIAARPPVVVFPNSFSGTALSLGALVFGLDAGTPVPSNNLASAGISSLATLANFSTTISGNGFGNGAPASLGGGNGSDTQAALLTGASGAPGGNQGASSLTQANLTMGPSGIAEGVLSLYVTAAGHEAAVQMAGDISSDEAIIASGFPALLGSSPVPEATILQVARLGDVTGSALDLIATPVTLTVVPANLEHELESAGAGTALLASFAPVGPGALGQGHDSSNTNSGTGRGDRATVVPSPSDPGAGPSNEAVERLAPWARFAAGLDEGWQRLRARLLETEGVGLAPGAAKKIGALSRTPRVSIRVLPDSPTSPAAVDAAVEDLDDSAASSNRLMQLEPSTFDEQTDCAHQPFSSVVVASMSLSLLWDWLMVAVRGRSLVRRRWRQSKLRRPLGARGSQPTRKSVRVPCGSELC
jgi:hypothetical protein